MSATGRLRELLDERGVEYDTDDEDGCEFTEWMANGLEWEADSRGELVYLTPVMLITPEQAIAATLGPGTCHNTQFAEMDEKADKKHRRAIASVLYGRSFPEDEPAEFTCSACGKTALIDWVTLYDIRFCPFCRAKVVDE